MTCLVNDCYRIVTAIFFTPSGPQNSTIFLTIYLMPPMKKHPVKPKQKPAESDIERLRAVARKMLNRLEEALNQEMDEGAAHRSQKAYEWLFGSRTSLAAILMTLA